MSYLASESYAMGFDTEASCQDQFGQTMHASEAGALAHSQILAVSQALATHTWGSSSSSAAPAVPAAKRVKVEALEDTDDVTPRSPAEAEALYQLLQVFLHFTFKLWRWSCCPRAALGTPWGHPR